MAEFPLPSSTISHLASAKTLTLSSPYNLLKLTDILRIYNLTIGAEIYDYRNPRKYKAPKNLSGIDISITDGVITYIADATMSNNDEIQIIVNIDNNSLSTKVDLFTNETVAASATVTSTTPLPVGKLSKLLVYVKNTGDSTNCTINIYTGSANSTTGSKRNLIPFTLGAGSSETPYEAGNGIDSRQLDNYAWAEIINSDSVNSAIISVEFSMFR